MTDLEITKLCYQALGNAPEVPMSEQYNPLSNDAQAMALVKKLGLHIDQRPNKPGQSTITGMNQISVQDPHFCILVHANINDPLGLNRAISTCAAKLFTAQHEQDSGSTQSPAE